MSRLKHLATNKINLFVKFTWAKVLEKNRNTKEEIRCPCLIFLKKLNP